MNLTIRTHHTAVQDGMKEHAEKKLSRLERYLPRVDSVVVEVEKEETRAAAHRYAVQVTVHSGGSILRGEERGADARAAFDAAVAVVSRQAQRHTKRLYDRHRAEPREERELPAAVAPGVAGDEAEQYRAGRVVRVKRFEAKPMSQDEALAQMDLLGHDFFLFLDADAGDYALLYKREDGDYGMLSPERG